MTDTLKPCPLCGSTDVLCYAEYEGDSYDNEPVYRAVVACRGCHEEGCDADYDIEPCFGIEAHYRGDHPLIRDAEDPEECEHILASYMAERWNRRAERTCRAVEFVEEETFGTAIYFECSECHETIGTLSKYGSHLPNYCPNCGARVVDEL